MYPLSGVPPQLRTMPRRLSGMLILQRLRTCSRKYSHEAYNSNDLNNGKDEFGFTVAFDAKHIDDYDDD